MNRKERLILVSLIMIVRSLDAAVEVTTVTGCDSTSIEYLSDDGFSMGCHTVDPPDPVCPTPHGQLLTRDWDWSVQAVDETNVRVDKNQTMAIKFTPTTVAVGTFNTVESTGTSVPRLASVSECPGDFTASAICVDDGTALGTTIRFAVEDPVWSYCVPALTVGREYYFNLTNANLDDDGNIIETCPGVCTFHYTLGHN